VLALYAGPRESARLPLVVRILKELPVKGRPVGLELMAPAAERCREKGRGARDPIVGEGLARSATGERAVAVRWAEALVAPHVTGGTGDPLVGQGRHEG